MATSAELEPMTPAACVRTRRPLDYGISKLKRHLMKLLKYNVMHETGAGEYLVREASSNANG